MNLGFVLQLDKGFLKLFPGRDPFQVKQKLLFGFLALREDSSLEKFWGAC